MRNNTPSDLASPARHSLAHRKSRRRPSGRFIAFPGEVSSRFHGLFRPLRFRALRGPPRFSRRVDDVSSFGRVCPSLVGLETRYSRNFWHFSQSAPRFSQYPSGLFPHLPIRSSSILPFSLLSFLPSFVAAFRRVDSATKNVLSWSFPFSSSRLFFTMPVALNRINLPARFEKIPSHNSVMKTRPGFPTYDL